jgi:quinohemoprotein ethanol dehydrogenase
MSFSPRTGLVYLHVYDAPMKIHDVRPAVYELGAIGQSTSGSFPPFDDPADKELLAKQHLEAKFEGRLKAWNPVTGKAAWQTEPLTFVSGGTMVAGDLVFQGTTGGYFNAYDAATGKRLLHLFLGTNIMGAPITYKLDGIQYVAVTAGAGGPQGSAFAPDTAAYKYENYERLVVMKLNGGEIPLPPERKPVQDEPVPQPIQVSDATMEHGHKLYETYCHRCHTMGGSIGIFPNLWNMSPAVIGSFEGIVEGGAYTYAGMSSFSNILSHDDIEAIKAFIVNDTIAAKTKGADAASRSRQATH